MRYFKYRDEESPIGDGTRYVETNEGWSVREVTVSNGVYIGSNVNYPRWGLCLAEGQTDYDELLADEPSEFEVQEITEREFQQIWSEHLAQNERRWCAAKISFSGWNTSQRTNSYLLSARRDYRFGRFCSWRCKSLGLQRVGWRRYSFDATFSFGGDCWLR